MCGRFVATRPIEDVAAIFGVDDIEVPAELEAPRWNVAPQAGVVAVRTRFRKPEGADENEGEFRRTLTDFRWGLVPSWAKDPSGGARAINARAETVTSKPAFRNALLKRRCVIPADAFYEWKRTGSGREPWCYTSTDGDLLSFAGLYEVWRPAEPSGHDDGPGWHDDWLLTCSIVTTDANDLVAAVHDRMPVILDREGVETWLKAETSDPSDLVGLLKPAARGVLRAFRVSTAVNNARLDGPELIQPVQPTQQPSLFGD